MFNELYQLFTHPNRGWDPISSTYSASYADQAWRDADPALISLISARTGGLAGKRVLDLGGGPGQYTVLLAKAGGRVTWHDVSHNYLKICQKHTREENVNVDFSVGHLEEAGKFTKDPFDVVFCRVCWWYSVDDRKFARLIYSLVKPGGLGYVETDVFNKEKSTMVRRLQATLNSLGFKIGHPLPMKGSVPSLIRKLSPESMTVQTYEGHEQIVFIR
jgi:2-polyprenyl-3-methyl-5-hydroxy-6-metoxy-1,4-benzoquinol methylase